MKYYYLAVTIIIVSVLASLCYSDYLKSSKTERERTGNKKVRIIN